MSVTLLIAALLQAQTPGGFTPITPEECRAERAAEGPVEAGDEAQCFVGWLYGPGVLESLEPLNRDVDRVFSTETAAAIRAVRARTLDGEPHPAFGADPLCQCQDPTGLIMTFLSTPYGGDDLAVSDVRFTFYPVYDAPVSEMTPEDVLGHRLVLRRQADGWRVHDIIMPEVGYSFLASLAE
jgi:hypothetical protein